MLCIDSCDSRTQPEKAIQCWEFDWLGQILFVLELLRHPWLSIHPGA